MKPVDKVAFVKWMRNNAKVLKKDFESWPEDFEIDDAAYLLEWAAETIVKYAPKELPPKKPRRNKNLLLEMNIGGWATAR